MHPAIHFARKLLLDEHHPPIWTEEIMEKGEKRIKPADGWGKVLVMGLGSRSPQARWIPLPKATEDGSLWPRKRQTGKVDWDVEKKCVCIMVFLVSACSQIQTPL